MSVADAFCIYYSYIRYIADRFDRIFAAKIIIN